MNRPATWWLAVSTLLTLSGGCAIAKQETVPITVKFDSDQCQLDSAQTHVFNSREALQQFVTDWTTVKTNRDNNSGPLPTVLGQKKPPTLLNTFETLATSHDFTRGKLVLVARGPQPNNAYGIGIMATDAVLAGHDLRLPLELQSPLPDKMYAQMLISPCVLLAVETATDIEKITLGQ